MDDTAESRLDSEQPAPGDHDDEKTSRTALALVNTVNKVVRNGIGPVTGSAAWAESRLRAVQGDRYDSSLLGRRGGTPAEDVDKVIGRLIRSR
ncbi:hypothetical protein [Micromonospora sp. b486]|uniref:hypothetical protein n=1 Tax=Micromonospora sp. b486 TaxID=3053986 RepID=UPI00259C7993|nr:hypothetical protein [Micromonospora sp. b486]MDM4784402.1 hypothetical protein [Micromonospora sp. b486]